MKEDMTELPPDVQVQIRALEVLPDDQIDTTDAPEIIDWSDARHGVFYRPVKQQITLRIDADIIAWFKAQGPRTWIPDGHQCRPPRARPENVSL